MMRLLILALIMLFPLLGQSQTIAEQLKQEMYDCIDIGERYKRVAQWRDDGVLEEKLANKEITLPELFPSISVRENKDIGPKEFNVLMATQCAAGVIGRVLKVADEQEEDTKNETEETPEPAPEEPKEDEETDDGDDVAEGPEDCKGNEIWYGAERGCKPFSLFPSR